MFDYSGIASGQNLTDGPRRGACNADGRCPVPGRVSDAGPARAIEPGIGPASESLRRRNPQESGERLAVYGDLTGQRLVGKGFGCRPRASDRTGYRAGVRKPPKKEPAG